MKNFEITIRPLSEEAKAEGCETLVTEVDAFILSSVSDMGNEKVNQNVQVSGPGIVWQALVYLVQNLAKDFPEEFSAILPVAMASVMLGKGDENTN